MHNILRHRRHALHKAGRLLSSPWRSAPDFIILGAMKAGTTSLYQYLQAHPAVVGAFRKELHFFDREGLFGQNHYRAYFPARRTLRAASNDPRRRAVTGESTPYYLFHPLGAERIRRRVPRVKLIALLRDPIERALSYYRFEVARELEPLSLEDAFNAEADRTARPPGQSLGKHYASFHVFHHSYLARGYYAEQLARYYDLFPAEQILVLKFEEFFASPEHEFPRVLRFLDLPAWRPPGDFKRFNPGRGHAELTKQLRRQLERHFAPHNRALRELTGQHITWGY